MKLSLYQVDAFADQVFRGNPAAVCPLEEWLSDELMQKIAMENNLSETAFFVKEDSSYRIRWFTPAIEVDLCGHATLASAYVLFNELDHIQNEIIFHSKSGELRVNKEGGKMILDFPADKIDPSEITKELAECFNYKIKESYKGKADYLFVFDSEEEIKTLQPDFTRIKRVDCRGIIATAHGDEVDFVSRFFAPQSGVDEDPVTGSAHTTLAPFWASRLGKSELTARQLSKRGGHLECEIKEDRVLIKGKAVNYLKGIIEI